MSNLIKAYSIRFKTDNKKTIDYKTKDLEIEARRQSLVEKSEDENGFEEGIQAVVVDSIISDEEKKAEAENLIEEAKKEAEEIINEAKREALRIKEETQKKAENQGYEDGLKKAAMEIQKIKNDLLEQKNKQEKEYQKLLTDFEWQAADLISSLITKLTGILVEDKKDIIIYLLEKALKDYDDLDSYDIRVSKEEYDLVLSKKEYLEDIAGKGIKISADPKLEKNQCQIETESKLIDCSLDVQLGNLVKDIKLLSSMSN